MQKNNTIGAIGLAAMILILLVGVFQLFMLGFESGELYPAYSSLRSDPIGTRAFYESLKNFEDVKVQRNYQILRSLKFEQDTTFFYLGVSEANWKSLPQEFIQVVDRLTQSGGRFVVSFMPVFKPSGKGQNKKCSSATKIGREKNQKFKSNEEGNNCISFKTHWGVGFEFNDRVLSEGSQFPQLVATSKRPHLPAVISWHSNLFFQLHDPAWQVIYSSENQPVMIERAFGKGTMVMCADSYFISNEALWSERYPKLLAWMAGANSSLVFDEAHFGIYKRPAVASLIRQYRFHWFVAALMVLALLFVWKNTVYFVPPRKDAVSLDDHVIAEKDVCQGLVALLRHNIPVRAMLATCVQEWEKTFKNDRRIAPRTFERIKNVIAKQDTSSKKQSDPVEGYQIISRIISKDRRYE